jgi:hypothetical protein
MTPRPPSVPNRRQFLQTSAAVAGGVPLFATAKPAAAAPSKSAPPETAVKALYDSLTEEQRKVVCFPWDHKDKTRGLLRTFVANNWQITKPTITGGDFYTKKQQGIAFDVYRGLTNPAWHERFETQCEDDSDGEPWGAKQSFAIFGEPGSDKFEFVLTGRHQTLRADGNSQGHMAFGGPIFYGHAGISDTEKPDHPANVFWPQAVAANHLYGVLDGKQRKAALVPTSPKEAAVAFRGAKLKDAPGLRTTDMTGDQKAELQKVLALLIEPFRADDRDEALACLKAQGGLDACVLTYYADPDLGKDGVWDNWRLEGPAFVWYFRGAPHVHVWVNVGDDPAVPLNA